MADIMKRLTDVNRRRFRILTKEVRQDYSYWDIDGLLEAQISLTNQQWIEYLEEHIAQFSERENVILTAEDWQALKSAIREKDAN